MPKGPSGQKIKPALIASAPWTYVAKITGHDGTVLESEVFKTFEEAWAFAGKYRDLAPEVVVTQFGSDGEKLMDHWLKNPKSPPPKSTKLPRKLPEDPIARGVAIMREATAEKPKPKRR